jgi:MOSC domain-containing protein YiiM
MDNQPFIHSIYIGQPKTISDSQGTWQTSIFRDQIDEPVRLELRGFTGDQATQPYHGTPELAVCGHFLAHYRFWNEQYGMMLKPGNVGENVALEHTSEDEICIGDIYRIGTALVQVSAPRTPCNNQARRIGRADWVKLTLVELRTGIYMRVLKPGIVQAGDKLLLEERPNPNGTVTALNRCYYQTFDPKEAQQFAIMPGLMEWWKQRFTDMLEQQ